MTFELLEKTPQVNPLLVRLYDTHNLYNLAGSKDSEAASMELTTIMVDLLNVRLNDRESELITDVLLALMKQAEVDLKVALAERLASMDHISLRMVLAMANDEISVADPILRNSPVLQDLDLLYILQAKGVEHGRAMAHRKHLGPEIINVLADTKDFEIAVNLSENDGLKLTEHAYTIFTDMAKGHDALAKPLLARTDLPKDVASKLYHFVGDELKKSLTRRYGIDAQVAVAVLDDITMEMVTDETELSHCDRLLAMAQNQVARGEMNASVMIATIRRGQYATFLAQFSAYCAVSKETAKTILRQTTGKALAITCKAKDITKADFVSMYLLTERFRSGSNGATKRLVNHKELTRIMTMFDEINAEQARTILKNSRH